MDLVLPPVQVGRSRGGNVNATIPAVAHLAAQAEVLQRKHLKMYLAVCLFVETRGMLSGLLLAFHFLESAQLITSPFIIESGSN